MLNRISIRKLKSSYQWPINNMLRGSSKVYDDEGLHQIHINTKVILFVDYELSCVRFSNVRMWHKFVHEILKNEYVRPASLWTNNYFTLEEKHYNVVRDVIDYMLNRYLDITKFEVMYTDIIKKEWSYLEKRNRFQI